MPKAKTPEQEINTRRLYLVKYINQEKRLIEYRRCIKREEEYLTTHTDPVEIDYCKKRIEDYKDSYQRHENEIQKLFVDRLYLRQISQIFRNGANPEVPVKFRKPIQG